MNKYDRNQYRREFLKTSLKTAAVVGVGALALPALSAQSTHDDAMSVSMPGNMKPVPTEELFRKGVIGPAELSRVTSEIAKLHSFRASVWPSFAAVDLKNAFAQETRR